MTMQFWQIILYLFFADLSNNKHFKPILNLA